MKKLLLPVVVLLIISCTNKKAETGTNIDSGQTKAKPDKEDTKQAEIFQSIVGKWRPVDVGLKDVEEKEKKDIMDNASIEFTADGEYISLFKEDKETGTYTYDEAGKLLTTKSPEGDIEKLSVGWTGDKLKLTNEEGVLIFKRVE